MENQLRVGLIKGRHEMPVEDYIFDEVQDVLDFAGIRNHLASWLTEHCEIGEINGCGIDQAGYTDSLIYKGAVKLVVYVTGLTSVTAELVRQCAMSGVSLTLMHYDRVTGTYVPQVIFD